MWDSNHTHTHTHKSKNTFIQAPSYMSTIGDDNAYMQRKLVLHTRPNHMCMPICMCVCAVHVYLHTVYLDVTSFSIIPHKIAIEFRKFNINRISFRLRSHTWQNMDIFAHPILCVRCLWPDNHTWSMNKRYTEQYLCWRESPRIMQSTRIWVRFCKYNRCQSPLADFTRITIAFFAHIWNRSILRL